MMAENSHLISKMPERETGLPNTYKVAFHEPQDRNRRKLILNIKLLQKLSLPNFCKKPENVAFRSILPSVRVSSTVPNSVPGIDGGPRRSWGVRRGAWGGRTVARRTLGANHGSRRQKGGVTLPLLVISGLATGPPAGVGDRLRFLSPR